MLTCSDEFLPNDCIGLQKVLGLAPPAKSSKMDVQVFHDADGVFRETTQRIFGCPGQSPRRRFALLAFHFAPFILASWASCSSMAALKSSSERRARSMNSVMRTIRF